MHREFLFIKDVHRRFCKYASACLLKCILRNVLRIIADQDTDPCHAADAEIVTYFMPQFLGSHSKLSLLFHVYALYITHISNLLCIFFHTVSCMYTSDICLYRITFLYISTINMINLFHKLT